jgi:hypothetical protein
MERAGSFTSIPGWGGVAIGITAVGAAAVAQGFLARPQLWLVVWLLDAVIAAAIAAFTMIRKGRRAGVALTSPAARRFFGSYLAPILSAGLLTLMFAMRGYFDALPATWLLLYGASFVSSGAFSIRIVSIMGLCYMMLGIAAAFTPMAVGNILLGAGFGGLHLLFGFIIARNHGG